MNLNLLDLKKQSTDEDMAARFDDSEHFDQWIYIVIGKFLNERCFRVCLGSVL